MGPEQHDAKAYVLQHGASPGPHLGVGKRRSECSRYHPRQQTGRRDAYLECRRPGGRDEGRGAVLRVYQWPEQAPARDRVEIDRRGARQLERRVGLCPLVPHGVVPARDAIELVYRVRSEEHTSELQSLTNLVCRLLLEKKKPAQ